MMVTAKWGRGIWMVQLITWSVLHTGHFPRRGLHLAAVSSFLPCLMEQCRQEWMSGNEFLTPSPWWTGHVEHLEIWNCLICLVKLIESDTTGVRQPGTQLSATRNHLFWARLPKTCCRCSGRLSSGQTVWAGLRSSPGIWTSWSLIDFLVWWGGGGLLKMYRIHVTDSAGLPFYLIIAIFVYTAITEPASIGSY